MQPVVKVILAFFAALVLIETVECIQCYVCNSHTDKDCETNVSPHYLKNCSDLKSGPKYISCRRIQQWVDNDQANMKAEERIVRTCGYVETERACYYRAGFGGRQEVCTCKDSACNTASATSVSLLLASVSLLTIASGLLPRIMQ